MWKGSWCRGRYIFFGPKRSLCAPFAVVDKAQPIAHHKARCRFCVLLCVEQTLGLQCTVIHAVVCCRIPTAQLKRPFSCAEPPRSHHASLFLRSLTHQGKAPALAGRQTKTKNPSLDPWRALPEMTAAKRKGGQQRHSPMLEGKNVVRKVTPCCGTAGGGRNGPRQLHFSSQKRAHAVSSGKA